ncbi:MAG TPA: hypothetical protein VFW73_12580 [Lacipirellulaceae bacterium]|nr:hypothetical protein [Lacipirellulaceae bacterium]
MCVFFCANPQVREWLDIPLALAQRQTFQQCPICPDEPDWEVPQHGVATKQAVLKKLDTAAELRVMKRTAWVHAYCIPTSQGRTSAQDWHKALETIANAWSRLLSFVGLRW